MQQRKHLVSIYLRQTFSLSQKKSLSCLPIQQADSFSPAQSGVGSHCKFAISFSSCLFLFTPKRWGSGVSRLIYHDFAPQYPCPPLRNV